MTAALTFDEAVQLRVAVADQQHTVRRLAAHTHGHQVAARDPWFVSLGVTVLGQLVSGRARLCPHVGPGRGFGPMYTQMGQAGRPLLVSCRDCFADRPRFGPVDDNTCDRCSVYARGGLVGGALPIGPMLLLFGVCGSCAGELELRQHEGASA
uniref:hypothetical protein n=1 Tax=Paractinoplanes polyasparticus TaxID=2856853 RepID=UPI001C84C824|nr:hypothetical protein [Actinoplanes polyasparticus]